MRASFKTGIKVTIFMALTLLTVNNTWGFSTWSPDCSSCHGGFSAAPYISPEGKIWPDSLHTVHDGSSYMNTSCLVCHTGMGGIAKMNQSKRDAYDRTPGYGCAGCHGSSTSGPPSGAGLREFHRKKGYHSCGGGPCHMLPEYSEPESLNPVNYGGPLTNVDDACNNGPAYLEDWSGDNIGLDNDGDLVRDTLDPDCIPTTSHTVPPTPTGTPTTTGTVPFTPTVAPSSTPTNIPSFTSTPIPSSTASSTPMFTHTYTSTVAPTLSPTFTPVVTLTITPEVTPSIPSGYPVTLLILITFITVTYVCSHFCHG